MAPPPVTPSPRRFIIQNPPASTARKTPLSQTHFAPPPPPSQLFNTTPRFSLPSTQHRPTYENAPSRPAPRFTTPGPRPSRFREPLGPEINDDEDILDAIESFDHPSDSHPDEVPTSPLIRDRRNFAEVDHESADERDTAAQHISKRRRLSPPLPQPLSPRRDTSSSASPTLNPPTSSPALISSPTQDTSRATPAVAPRFKISNPSNNPSTPARASAHPQSTAPSQPFHRPPRFRAPADSTENEQTTDPLPHHFSPNRRGQKYVNGGLASEVRDWIVALENGGGPVVGSAIIGSAAVAGIVGAIGGHTGTAERASTAAHAGGAREEWTVRIVIEEVSGGSGAGMTLVRGRQVHINAGRDDTTRELKVVLAGEGGVVGLQRTRKVEAGVTVGIKGPMWDVVVDGERWGVGVDWKILE